MHSKIVTTLNKNDWNVRRIRQFFVTQYVMKYYTKEEQQVINVKHRFSGFFQRIIQAIPSARGVAQRHDSRRIKANWQIALSK